MRSAIFPSIGFAVLLSAVACKSDAPAAAADDDDTHETGGASGKGGAGGNDKKGSGGTSASSSNTKGAGGEGDGSGKGGAEEGAGGKAGTGGKTGTGGKAGTGGKSGVGGGAGEGESGGKGEDGGSAAAGAGGDSSGGDKSGAGGAAGRGSGTDGGGAAVAPTCDSADKCTFAWGDYKFVVDGKIGARIVEFSLGGKNILADKSVSGDNYGSTFLTSPQSDFGWPPPDAIDKSPYTKGTCNGCLLFTSSSVTVGSKPAVTVEKKFQVNAASGVVSILYSIVNPGSASVQFAPWEITRANAGGVTFWPSGAHEPTQARTDMDQPVTTASGDYTFYPYKKPETRDQKLNGEAGAKAYLAQVNGDLMLVKAWTDVPNDSSHQPSGEGEVEIYANKTSAYIEVEEQGASTSIPAKGRLDWPVRWSLQKLAASISSPAAAVGDKTLTDLADSMAKAE